MTFSLKFYVIPKVGYVYMPHPIEINRIIWLEKNVDCTIIYNNKMDFYLRHAINNLSLLVGVKSNLVLIHALGGQISLFQHLNMKCKCWQASSIAQRFIIYASSLECCLCATQCDIASIASIIRHNETTLNEQCAALLRPKNLFWTSQMSYLTNRRTIRPFAIRCYLLRAWNSDVQRCQCLLKHGNGVITN